MKNLSSHQAILAVSLRTPQQKSQQSVPNIRKTATHFQNIDSQFNSWRNSWMAERAGGQLAAGRQLFPFGPKSQLFVVTCGWPY